VEVEIDMGVWSFVKDAGKKLFGGEAEAAEAPEEALHKEIRDLGLDPAGLDLKVEGDKVKVAGKAVSPEMKEKVILAVGNVAGVAAVETADDGDTKDAVFHTVAKGDTLSAIAKKTLGNANRYMEIFEANKPMLKHPDKIYPGQVLRIPKS
jgi:nucleoid-associated protein YgaU